MARGAMNYEVGLWAGHMQWRCRLCPWDTLEGEAAMLAHLASRHGPGLQPPYHFPMGEAPEWFRRQESERREEENLTTNPLETSRAGHTNDTNEKQAQE